jgi:hypothetical protein
MKKQLASLLLLYPAVAFGSPLTDALKAVAEKCTVNPVYATISNCPAGEDAALEAIIDKSGADKVLPDLANAFVGKDEKVALVAINCLEKLKLQGRLRDIYKDPSLVSDKTVDTLIKGLAQNRNYVSVYAAGITTILATLKKKDAALFKVLDSHPQSATRNEGYLWAMHQGRLRVFDRIKKAAKDRKSEYLADAALKAPEHMYDYTEKEKKVVCEWAKGYLENPDPLYAYHSARLLVLKCPGSYIDDVLTKAEALNAEGKLADHPFRDALTNFSFSCKESRGSPPTGTPEQCARSAALVGE